MQKSDKNKPRNLSARWWRQVGFWGLTLNAVFGFPALMLVALVSPHTDLGAFVGIYPGILATWAIAAGIREWGKTRGTEDHHGPLDSNENIQPPEGFTQ